ncbi:hypothetical protein [Streptomyces malaysiensis]|uniref:hypothetical protein n=1 Tax=Streptomyces malaysiensis TaxID=92644 RepID=UPI002B30ED21|nr:hypothetical protein R8789_44470 [Streptomyces malaysiensis]
MQPGAVSTSGAGKATAFFTDNDPYTPLHQQLGTLRDAAVTAEEVAATVADTIEQPEPPLRVPAGAPAERILRRLPRASRSCRSGSTGRGSARCRHASAVTA